MGVRPAGIRTALVNGTHRETIRRDTDLAAQLGVRGTPSFFINGRNLRGAQPMDAFVTAVERELAAARALVAQGHPRSRVYDLVMASGF